MYQNYTVIAYHKKDKDFEQKRENCEYPFGLFAQICRLMKLNSLELKADYQVECNLRGQYPTQEKVSPLKTRKVALTTELVKRHQVCEI
jgi:hypothetical protein